MHRTWKRRRLLAVAAIGFSSALTLPASAGAAVTPTLDSLMSGASGSITAAFSNPPDPAGYNYNAVRCVNVSALDGAPEPDPATWTRWGSPPPAAQITSSPATRTGFVDGDEYKCYTTEVDDAGAVSARSNMLTVTVGVPTDAGPPPAPTGMAASNSGTTNTISWDAPANGDHSYTAVRWSTDPNKPLEQWTRIGTPPDGNWATSPATHANLSPGTYYYYATNVDTETLVSERSAVVSATVSGTPPPPSPPPGGGVVWGTDFETGAFEDYKSTIRKSGAGNNATRSITTEQARTGSKSAKIVMPASTSSSGVARFQMLADMPSGQAGTDLWYGWSVRLGGDWAGTGCALTQLTDNASYFMGQGGFRYTSTSANGPGANPGLDGNLPGRWSIGLNLTNTVGGDDDQQRDLGPICENTWKDFVFHVKWASSGGVFETYADGVKVGSTYTGKTLGTASGVFEHRQGLYQGSSVNHTRTLYLDNHRVGTSYAAVDPSR